jgi:hypothetical protein
VIERKTAKNAFRKCFRELEQSGILLLSDNRLPSITSFVVGKPVRGSWWGHPKGHDIFRVLSRVADHPDVAVTKLISGKITFVHRKLWPALVAIGISREPWKMNGLSRKSRNLLQIVDREGEVRADRLPSKRTNAGWREAIRELEERLLIYAEEFHSETGAHAKRLESWKHWAKRIGLVLEQMTAEIAKQKIMQLTQKIATVGDENMKLPWLKN